MPLKRWFAREDCASVTLTFREIETILGCKLSPSVRKYTSRWYTRPDRNAIAEAWVTEGYELFKLDLDREKVTFHRTKDGTSHVKLPEWLTAGKIPDGARSELENFFVYVKRKYGFSSALALLREIEYTQNGTDSKLFELDQSIAALNDKSLTLQKLSTKGFISPEEYRIQSKALAAQCQRLTAQRNKKLHGLQSHSAVEKLEELQAILSGWDGVPTEFDIDQFDEVVEKIIPTAGNKLIFRLHCGLELTEDIPT